MDMNYCLGGLDLNSLVLEDPPIHVSRSSTGPSAHIVVEIGQTLTSEAKLYSFEHKKIHSKERKLILRRESITYIMLRENYIYMSTPLQILNLNYILLRQNYIYMSSPLQILNLNYIMLQ